MKLRTLLLAGIFSMGSPFASAEQVCNDRIVHTTPSFRFDTNPDGTATDLVTGLRWLRCPVGFALNDNGTPGGELADDSCDETGESRLSWAEAFAAAEALNANGGIGGFTDWRVPNLKELMSLVERKCLEPALNTRIFPRLPHYEFWSATTYWYLTTAATIDFRGGVNGSSDKELDGGRQYLRLVR